MTQDATWMNVEDVKLREMSQSQKDTYDPSRSRYVEQAKS